MMGNDFKGQTADSMNCACDELLHMYHCVHHHMEALNVVIQICSTLLKNFPTYPLGLARLARLHTHILPALMALYPDLP